MIYSALLDVRRSIILGTRELMLKSTLKSALKVAVLLSWVPALGRGQDTTHPSCVVLHPTLG